MPPIIPSTILVLLSAVAAGQELPRSELIDHCRKLREAKVEPLAAELKTVQANLKKARRKDLIIAARDREKSIKAKLAAIEEAGDMAPGIDIAKIEPGQIGTLFIGQDISRSTVSPDGRGGTFTIQSVFTARKPVEVTVAEVIDANAMLVEFDGAALYMRTPTAGLVIGKRLTLDMPVKCVGVRKRGAEPMFELATFAKE